MKLHVKVDATSPACQWNDEFWQSEVTYIAEIRTRDGPGSELGLIEKDFVSSQIRTKEHKDRPYHRGRSIDIRTVHSENCSWKHVTVIFNSERCAWHYGWVSHKHSRNTAHVLDVLVMFDSPVLPTHFFITGSYVSPEFRVSSTKRSRRTSAPSASSSSKDEEAVERWK
jgi:hypothetical protein